MLFMLWSPVIGASNGLLDLLHLRQILNSSFWKALPETVGIQCGECVCEVAVLLW